MEKFIHSYLTKHYELIKDRGILHRNCDLISLKGADEIKYWLRDDVMTIFTITQDEAKGLITTWALTMNPLVDLESYWEMSEPNTGGDNIAIGMEALYANTTGNNNNVYGYSALNGGDCITALGQAILMEVAN